MAESSSKVHKRGDPALPNVPDPTNLVGRALTVIPPPTSTHPSSTPSVSLSSASPTTSTTPDTGQGTQSLPTTTTTASTSSISSPTSTGLSDDPTQHSSGLPISASATTTMSSGPATFTFTNLPNPFACGSATITWICTGPQESVVIWLTRNLSPRPLTAAVGLSKRDDFPLPIAVDVDTSLQTWTWNPVNVPQGEYRLFVNQSQLQATSDAFQVFNGTDTSCLMSPSAPPSSSSSVAPSSISPSPSSASIGSTELAASSITTSGPTALPVGAVASSSHVRVGAIAGGVIGGLVIVVAVIAAYFYFGLCRRAPTRSRRRGMDGPAALGKWGGLSSRDSGMDVVGAPVSGKHRRVRTGSSGAMLSPVSPAAHSPGAQGVQGTSDEDIMTLAGVEEEKGIMYGKGHEYAENVPPMGYSNRRRSSLSTSGASSPVTSIPEQPLGVYGSIGRTRARTSSQSHRALAFAKLDGNDSVPASPRTRSPTVPHPRRSIDASPMAMPASPPLDASPLNRTSSGGGPGAPRRAARKPVPVLDDAELSHSLPPRGQSVASTVTVYSAAPSPTGAHTMYRNESQSSGTLRPPAPGRQHSREDLEAAGLELPNLNHKSSFGDRPVHYLIPDLPPPQRN